MSLDSFPILESLFSRILDDKSQVLIEGMLRKMLADRRGIPRNNDLADILNELRQRLDEEELREKGITEGVVIAQALAMLVGGYDPTHANVIHLLYFLAINPEAQARLQTEILRTHPNARRLGLTYESIQDSNLPYLVACMKEAVRMCPSVFRPERICNRDWSYGGYRIRKGTVVRVATFGLHFNPNYFPDPYNYRPERFLEGSTTTTVVPYSYVPFGYGPRTCIGMRFANESTKIFMINLLSCFTIKARPDAKLVYKPGKTILAYLKEPLYLDLEPRI
jgi:cytochrome P450